MIQSRCVPVMLLHIATPKNAISLIRSTHSRHPSLCSLGLGFVLRVLEVYGLVVLLCLKVIIAKAYVDEQHATSPHPGCYVLNLGASSLLTMSSLCCMLHSKNSSKNGLAVPEPHHSLTLNLQPSLSTILRHLDRPGYGE